MINWPIAKQKLDKMTDRTTHMAELCSNGVSPNLYTFFWKKQSMTGSDIAGITTKDRTL